MGTRMMRGKMMGNKQQAQRGVAVPCAANIVRETLPNGITILIYENHSAQSVVLSGVIGGGGIYDSEATSGLASLTASALMRGAEGRDFDAIHEQLENIGADFGVGVGAHRANFYGKALGEDLATVADIMSDVLRHPSFPAEHLERLRGEIVTGLQYRQHDTRYRADRAFREALYPVGHPYRRARGGTLETIPTLTRAQVQDFHRTHYGPQGMVVVLSGAVQAAQAIDILRARLADWHNPAQQTPPTMPPLGEQSAMRVDVSVAGKTQSDIVMGVVGPARNAPDYQAATMINSIFGQFGMMGRVGKIVREEMGLAYYTGSRIEGGQGPGAWLVSSGVNPKNVEKAIDATRHEFRRLTEELVSDEDINDCKTYFTGHLPLQLENNDGLAATILNIETYKLGMDYLLGYREMIYALTKEDLRAAAARYINADALVIATAG
jgi:zinc protease